MTENAILCPPSSFNEYLSVLSDVGVNVFVAENYHEKSPEERVEVLRRMDTTSRFVLVSGDASEMDHAERHRFLELPAGNACTVQQVAEQFADDA